MSYEPAFSSVYDKFISSADFDARAAYVLRKLQENGVSGGILLDLACGTGRMSEFLLQHGFDLICTDISSAMLMQARQRLLPYGGRALILQQDMRELDLFGTIRACVCCMDAVNHLTCAADVQRVFDRVSLFTEPGGVFIFDANTVYKHRCVLADNAFVYEDDRDFLVWQNEYDPADDSVQMFLDVFTEGADGRFSRESEEITERAYETDELAAMLQKAGFSKISVYGDLTDLPPAPEEERVCFVAVK